ncbi:transmembrane protein, putative (macronuclear) [Tetrahymena thermophila SB210]|uniref:Transmembrane protein, putative n=1 Tax=Tetrahymena thermophila (strain SB210) TaxID=312017 RepID=I7MB15_TETTS|nr:transmembrane protein, putative [Tetrahymena thermophila SB210]EAS07116.1 transmembrane protein, putative [Tetrahymena thermophila SB210]|eukprot:XP_001027358.1 transmembrane protein, putative [Tetrahymena thermophila SB210]
MSDDSSQNTKKEGQYQQVNNTEYKILQHGNAETHNSDKEEKRENVKKTNSGCIEKLKSKHKQFRNWWESIPPVKRIASFLAAQLLPMAISISLTKTTQSDWQNHSNQIQALGDNYNSHFYIDFSVKQQCSMDETNVMEYIWPGLNQGCDCYSSSGVINSNYQNCQCSQVPSWDPVAFQYLFTNGPQKLTLCAKRSLLNFFNVGPLSGHSCTSLQKQCGNPSKPETVLCVGLNDPCPIYDIIFTNGVQQPYASDPNWGQIQINSNQYIYFDKLGANANNLPLSQFVFTAGAGVCIDNYTQQNIDQIRLDYPLSKSQRTACSNTDPRFYFVYQIGVNQLYLTEFSTQDYNLLSQLSGMQLSTSTEVYKLYKRPYEPWNVNDRYKILIFQSIIDDVTFQQFLFSASFIINTAASSVFYVFGIIYGYYQHINLLRNDKYKIAIWNALNTIMSLLSKSLSFIMSVVTLAFALDYALKFTVLINNHPSTDIFQQQCQNQLDYINSIFKSNYIVTIIITGIYLLKDIIDIIPDLYTAYKEKKKQQQSQKVSSEKQEQENNKEKKQQDGKKEKKQTKNQGDQKQNQEKQFEEWKKQQLKEYDNWQNLVAQQKEEQLQLSTKQQDEWQKLQQQIEEEQKKLKSKQAEDQEKLKQKQNDEEQKFSQKQTDQEQKQQFKLKQQQENLNLQNKQNEDQQKLNTDQADRQHKMLAKQSQEQQQLSQKQQQEQRKLLQSQKEEQQKLLQKQEQENHKQSSEQRQNQQNDEQQQSESQQQIQQLKQLTQLPNLSHGQFELKGVISNLQ